MSNKIGKKILSLNGYYGKVVSRPSKNNYTVLWEDNSLEYNVTKRDYQTMRKKYKNTKFIKEIV